MRIYEHERVCGEIADFRHKSAIRHTQVAGPTSQVDHDAIAVLHQHALGVAELGLFAGTLFGQPRFGVGGGLMGRVPALLAVEVNARITRIIGRGAIARLLILGRSLLSEAHASIHDVCAG
jgi:hypothetical protein